LFGTFIHQPQMNIAAQSYKKIAKTANKSTVN